MPRFEPDIEITWLDKAKPGSIVIVNGAPGFVAIAQGPRTPAPVFVLAQYDVTQRLFLYRYFEHMPKVLAFKGEAIIRPDVTKLHPDADFQAATSNLFVHDQHYIRVVIPGSSDVKVLGLGHGNLVTATAQTLPAFPTWEIGVMSLGQFLPILKVPGSPPPMTISDEILEPDVV